MIRGTLDNVLLGIKAGFKSILNIFKHPNGKSRMFNLKRNSKLSATLLALIMGASFILGSPAAAKEPQYGGTLTMIMPQMHWNEPKVGMDVTKANWQASGWTSPFIPQVLEGDVEKYGERGDKSYGFLLAEETPVAKMRGNVAESWEIQPDKAIFHIRKGIMWTSRDGGVIKEPREFIAEDAAIALNRWLKSEIGAKTIGAIKSISAQDKYTLVFETDPFKFSLYFWVLYGVGGQLYAPETIDAGPNNWENMAGTGPFIMTDYVEGSAAIYEKNPLFWRKTTVNGKEYDLPFVDKLVWPIIVDESTRIAALRTGKVDLYPHAAVTFREDLAKTAPKLIRKSGPGGQGYYVGVKNDQGKFADRNLRRALMMGTDQDTLAKSVFGDGYANWQFSIGTDAHTPLSEMPESTRILYEYHPEKAKQMIAEAGYPNGFKMQLDVASNLHPEIGEILKDQWSRLGIGVEIQTVEHTAFHKARIDASYKEAQVAADGAQLAYVQLDQKRWQSQNNSTRFNNGHFNKLMNQFDEESDIAKQNAILKEALLYFKDEAARIELASPYVDHYHWPWVKNYYAEVNAGYWNTMPGVQTIWIDEDLKDEMGF